MTPGKIQTSTICCTCKRRLDAFAPSNSRQSSYTTVFPGRVVAVDATYSDVINVAANPFEEPDRFRNVPHCGSRYLTLSISGKICKRVRPTTDAAESEMGVSPTRRSIKAQFVCGMATAGLEADGGSVLLVASANPFSWK